MSAVLLVGVIAAVLSNALQALGLVFQRKAECVELFLLQAASLEREDVNHGANHLAGPAVTERCISVPSRYTVCRNRMWQLGFSLFLLANLFGCVIQIATLPLIILAPLQASGLVFNSLFSHLLLKEPFPFFSTVLVCFGGTIMASMSCTYINSPLTHTFEELWELAHDNRFIHYFLATNFLALLSLCAAVCSTRKRVKGFCYVFASGIWSAHALLIAKCVSDIIVTELTISVHTIFLSAILGIFSLTQLYLLNVGLAHLSTSILYPFVFSIYNLTTIFNSTMFYHDSLVPHTAHFLYTGLIIGFIVLTTGVVSISVSTYEFEEALMHEPKLAFDSNSVASSSPISSSQFAQLSYGSMNQGRPLSQEFLQDSNTYTSLVV